MKLRYLLMLALSAMLVAAAPAAAKPKHKKKPPRSLKAIWGGNTLLDGQSAFPIYKALGVDVLEYQLRWAKQAQTRPVDPRNPDDPAYHWPAELDEAYAASKQYGFELAIMLRTTPDWANQGQGPDTKPDNPQDFADFAYAAAKHYKRVRIWMIWGEPSRGPTFLPFEQNSPVAAQNYAVLVDRAYGALKKVRKRNKVVGGMSWSGGLIYPIQWLKWMKLPNGKPPRLDWYGHNPFGRYPRLSDHPYYPGVRDISDVDTFHREIARAYRVRHVKPRLWLSEFTVSSDRANKGFSFFVSRAEQARWLTAAYRLAHRHRYIAGLGWWKLQDEAEANGTTSGLFDNQGAHKPAYNAYKRAR